MSEIDDLAETIGEGPLGRYQSGDAQQRNAEKTRCRRGHPLTDDNVYVYRVGPGERWLNRQCKACKRLEARARYLKSRG